MKRGFREGYISGLTIRNMTTRTGSGTASLSVALGSILLGVLLFGLAPQSASAAASTNATLGGSNALSRATSGQSQGLVRANTTSDLFTHLTFASTRGGRSAETPPANEQSDTGGTTSTDQSDGPSGENGDAAGVSAGGGNASNGGASAGNGGNGGDGGASSGNGGPGTTSSQGSDGYGAGDGGNGGSASTGGLVKAGSVVSNSTAINMINLNIVRIISR